MWTPLKDGHWVAMCADLSDIVMSEPEQVSNNTVLVPTATGKAYRLIPLSLDPPTHRPFRDQLNDNLGPMLLKPIERSFVDLTVELIDSFRDSGTCNFVHDFAEKLPVTVFMNLVDMPKLKHLADQFTRPDGSMTYPEVLEAFRDYLKPVLDQRRGGSGEDMITRMISAQIDGRPLSKIEALSICTQVLVGGLDTVVNMLGFTFPYLARDHALREAIAADPELINDALLEFFRRLPVVSSSREVRDGVEFDGVQL